ncbi:glycine zipper 2TM domain-containing protein [Stenotrophomonas sp. S39]|uniref:glycine zipper 2TM domain-containing protein n=1 Tax=Stenotrophomonas sp. S39 TaxID=2767451 RepID=UPI00190DA682|nr:glycine zipper 2TM domain-containing protein [Stenotrophomonas sp. S39]MBK0053090.1 osmotically-inducible lipoprotein OsmB [Stenotrophomonas sp. S39]
MKALTALAGPSLALALAFGFSAAIVPSDASAMSKKDRRTLVGALVGGIGGSLLSNGDPWATVGGALAGGTVGNVTAKDHDDRRRWERERDRRHRDWRRDDRNRWEHDRNRRPYRGR